MNSTPTTVAVDNSGFIDDWSASLFISGAIVVGGSYAASAIIAGTDDHVGAQRLYVPIVGPWLALDDWGDCPITNPACDSSTTDKVLLVVDGVFQAAGLITMIDGILDPPYHRSRSRVADKSLHLSPTRNGMMVSGRF